MLPGPTERLRFREMTPADLDELAVVLGSPDPTRPRKRLWTRENAERWIEWNVSNYANHGHGQWIIETHDGRLVGDCGLTIQYIEEQPHTEVGYHVALELRRQGLATEAAAQVRETARAAGVEHLVAIIRPDNIPSQAVARNIGLSLEREADKNGGPVLVFGASLQGTPR